MQTLSASLNLGGTSRDVMDDLSGLRNEFVGQSQLFGGPEVVGDDSSRGANSSSSSFESVIGFTLESEFVPD